MKHTQQYCDLVNALREFERDHAIWMNTCIFTPEGERAKQTKNESTIKYAKAYAIWERSKRETIEECH